MTTSFDPAIAYSVASNFHDLSHLLNHPAGEKMGYDKDFQYQMVSFHRIPSPAWIRAPFLTLGQVKAALELMPFLWNDSRPRIASAYTGLRIYDETFLSELQKDWNEETQSWEDSENTNRQVLFGQTYEDYAVLFTGIPSLARQKGEEKEEWSFRVKEQRAARKAEKDAYRDFIWKIDKEQDQIRENFGLESADDAKKED